MNTFEYLLPLYPLAIYEHCYMSFKLDNECYNTVYTSYMYSIPYVKIA